MYETILVPTDGSAGAGVALEEGIRIARESGGTVHTLYVVDTAAAYADSGYVDITDSLEQVGQRAVDEAVERAQDADIEAVGEVRPGTPHRTILEYADEHDVDLVIMGTHGRTGIERYLLGSVTEKVVRTADVPVLTVREPEESAEAEGAD